MDKIESQQIKYLLYTTIGLLISTLMSVLHLGALSSSLYTEANIYWFYNARILYYSGFILAIYGFIGFIYQKLKY